MTSTEIIEKNKLNTDSVWIKLLEVTIPNEANKLYLCDTNDTITYNGNNYIPFPFTLPEIQQSIDGSTKEVTMTLSNVRRYLGTYIAGYDAYRKGGGNESIIITLKIVNSEALTNLNPLMWTFKVLSFSATAENVSLVIGGDNINQRMFPYWRLTRVCQWKFKDVNTCQYVGTETYCDKSLNQCKTFNNTLNFGGFLSLTPNGINF